MSGENISPNQPEFVIIFLSNINFHLHYLSCSRSSLTSSQPHTRARGVLLLSEVLQECYRELTEREGTPFSFHILCRHCTASCKVTNQKCTQITTFYIHICRLRWRLFMSRGDQHSAFLPVLLRSGSAYCLLWKPSEGSLCRHTSRLKGAKGAG